MAAIVKAYREYWDEMLAVGLGVVVTDLAGNTIKSFVGPLLDKVGLSNWVDPISEFGIGAGILAVTEMLMPSGSKYKIYGRLMSFGATAVAVADAVAIAIGMVTPTAAKARPTVPTYVPPTVRPPMATPPIVIPPPTYARPTAPVAVTVSPSPAPATERAPKIFGS